MIHMGDGMGFCFRACLDSRFTCELNYEREQCVPVERKVKCRHNSQPCESESPPAILFHSDDHILPWIMTLFSQILRSPFVMKSSTNRANHFNSALDRWLFRCRNFTWLVIFIRHRQWKHLGQKLTTMSVETKS